MKRFPKNWLVVLALTLVMLLGLNPMRAADAPPVPPQPGAAPAAANTNAPASPPPPSLAQKQLRKLVDKINGKLASGVRTQEELAPELKEFDALLAEHKQDKSDDVAQIVWMKAMIYIQVWQDTEQGKKVLQQLQADFPKSKFASQIVSVLLDELTGRVNTKIKASTGPLTESSFAAELKEFDALLAAHATEKTEEVARILWMKAMIYMQALMDMKKGRELLDQLKRDFPKTQFAAQADQAFVKMEQSMEQMEAMRKMQEDSRKNQESLGIKIGSKFPDFTETDIAGQPVSLARYKGKVVLLDFWATWCGPCIGELPHVLAAYAKHHGNGFEIVGISRDQDPQKLKSFIAANNMGWQQYFDGYENKLAMKYGIIGIPATFLVDGSGTLIARDLRGPALEAAVAEALAKK